MDTYMSFINNLKKAKETIKNAAASRPAFAKFLDAMARDHKGKLSLDNLLIKPVQKFPSYKLLIQRLIKHTGMVLVKNFRNFHCKNILLFLLFFGYFLNICYLVTQWLN